MIENGQDGSWPRLNEKTLPLERLLDDELTADN
jgi:hypothetical protein